MIEGTINEILISGKGFQWKAIQLQNIVKEVHDQFNQPEFRDQFSNLALKLQNEISFHQKESTQIEEMLKENKSLLERKEEIENRYSALEEKLRQVKVLKEKNRILNLPENEPSKINDDISKFFGDKDEIITKHIETLQKLNEVFTTSNSDLELQLASKINEAIKNLAAIQNKQTDGLNKLEITPIKTLYIDFGNEVNRLVEEYNWYVDKISNIKTDLEEISVKHDEVIETFKAHKLENETIFGALQSREGVLNHVNLLRKEIDERLFKFDNEIREIVEKRDQLPIYQLSETKKFQ